MIVCALSGVVSLVCAGQTHFAPGNKCTRLQAVGLRGRAIRCSIILATLRSIGQVCGGVKSILEEKRMDIFGNLGPTELLVILGICGMCLLPILVGGVAVVIVLISRR
jgi:hypothetical protein